MNFQFQHSYASLSDSLFTPTLPTPVAQPELLLFNQSLAATMGIHFDVSETSEIAKQLSGNTVVAGAFPIAQAYAGHQFGHFTMLGDGRAILLGEHLTPNDTRLDVQLKGAGPTPYSRRGDGRATLRAMFREYLISEAMHGLGIPSSRSLAVVTTGESVYREQIHEGAVLTRIAASHIRVGTFEYIRHFEDTSTLQEFTNYTIKRHNPTLLQEPNQALALLEAVMHQQIDLVVHWMRVGFIHGVMNTDNTSIAGETFDYGPCAFMNQYHPQTVFSSIDQQGRYAYANQPMILQWNLGCLAGALLPLINENQEAAVELAKSVLNNYKPIYQAKWLAMMGKKIGFSHFADEAELKKLVVDLLKWMQNHQVDYTNTFLAIANMPLANLPIYQTPDFKQWLLQREQLLAANQINEEAAAQVMQANNPNWIARNHQVEAALDSVCGERDFSLFNQLLTALKDPYQHSEQYNWLQNPPSITENEAYATFCGT